jgi:class 3 adenylate cyclase
MRALLGRLLALGVRPDDDEDTRLRKFLLLVAVLTIAPLAVLWGLLYWVVGATVPALIPWVYAAISLIGVVVFAITGRYAWFAMSQFAPYVTLPFVLMWTLGGLVHGSAVALWAGLAPIVALLLGHRRLAALLVVSYAALIVASVLVPAPVGATAPDAPRDVFFILNLAGVPLVGWLLVRVFAGGREGALSSVRSMIRRYLPAEVVDALTADPRRLELGGEIAQVTIMFADLGGYSSYAETRSPAEVVRLLNRYFALSLPAILEEGGTPVQLPGDAVVAAFGTPTPRPDHAIRACRAALSILERTAPLASGPDGGPRFHIGINSGPALVGNIGSEEYRNFVAIGDTTNVAARLQSEAKAGEIVLGPETARLLDGSLPLTPLGAVRVKGREQPVEAFTIRAE